MYVSDSNIFPSKGMRIRICHMDGRNYVIDLSTNIKIDELKIMSLSHFSDPAESIKTSLYHKVLLVRTGQVLSEEKTISEAGVKENGKNEVNLATGISSWVEHIFYKQSLVALLSPFQKSTKTVGK